MSAIAGPYGTLAEFEVATVEVKKVLPASEGRAEATIYKLGLIGPDGKGYAELFQRGGQAPTEGSKQTFILEAPKQDGWLPSAKPPRQGGGRGRSPAETKAIQRQHSQEMALRALALTPDSTRKLSDDDLRRDIEAWTDWFERDISGGNG